MRAARNEPATFLINRVAEELAERLAAVLRDFQNTADIATPTDAVRRALSARIAAIETIDFTPAETLPLEERSLDLAVSALALQFVNDLPGALTRIRLALKPDGLLLAAIAGGDTLTELRQSFTAAEAELEGGASPRVVPFVDLRDMGALLQRAGFALPVVDVERIVVRYGDAFSLMRDLRAHGRDQHARRSAGAPAAPRHAVSHGANLCRALRRSRRPHPRHFRHRLAVRLGAA